MGHLTVEDAPKMDSTPIDEINISHVTVCSISNRRISIPIMVETNDNTERFTALIDCGAEGLFIDKGISHKWQKQKTKPTKVQNIDGTPNIEGEITEQSLITFNMNGKCMTEWFSITALGNQKFILGLPWLEKHNPDVNWQTMTLEFQDSEKDEIKASLRSIYQKIDRIAMPKREEDLVIRYLSSHKGPTKTDLRWKETFEDIGSWSEDTVSHLTIACYTPAQQMEHKYQSQKEKVHTLPPEYSAYKKVFEKKASERFPESRSWDHQIELREDFKPKRGKIYPLSPKQQNALDEWIEEYLKKGYISRSKSPQASPFFFVEKKEAGKLRPCQDYRYLNEFTKPNAYPLPLISDLMIKLKGSEYFTKLDIRWGYNNVQIKESDRWKATFITNRGLFEPNVMFFGLRNSPATFQAMMDDYFRDLTETGHVIIYMDDILIHARMKEELEI